MQRSLLTATSDGCRDWQELRPRPSPYQLAVAVRNGSDRSLLQPLRSQEGFRCSWGRWLRRALCASFVHAPLAMSVTHPNFEALVSSSLERYNPRRYGWVRVRLPNPDSATFAALYVLDFELSGPNGSAMVRSAWIVRKGEEFPRFTRCYVL